MSEKSLSDFVGKRGRSLNNEEVINEILVKGDPSELVELQEFHHLSPEQISLFVAYARLRHKIHLQMRDELRKRKEQNPKATDEELRMGAYIENIEPQVREAVLLMRKKGYPTYESGFSGPPDNVQKIGFEDSCLGNFTIPQNLFDELAQKGINFEKKDNYIKLSFSHLVKIDEIVEIWNSIAKILPDRGFLAASAKLPAAESFRARQEKL